MRAKIWGCRGSLAAPGPATVRYGGNTACVEVRVPGAPLIILDAGTGIRPLGLELEKESPKVVHLLLTHLHLDHLQGLGFLPAFWDPQVSFHIWGPASALYSLEERIERYLSPPLFPVHLSVVSSRIAFHDVPDQPWEIGPARLLAEPVSHQGPTLGYRIEHGGRSLAYLPDHEPARLGSLTEIKPEWISGCGVAAEADVLLHDAQYTDEEYAERVGWGHSTVAQAVTFAQVAGVRSMVMFHHDPMHSDDQLEELLEGARRQWGARPNPPVLAWEGLELAL